MLRTTGSSFSDAFVICSAGNIWMYSTKRYKFSAFLQVQFPMLESHPCGRQTCHKFSFRLSIEIHDNIESGSFVPSSTADRLSENKEQRRKGLEIAQHERKFTLMRWKHRPNPSTLSRKVGYGWMIHCSTFRYQNVHIVRDRAAHNSTLTLNFRLTHVAIAFDDTFSSDPIPASVNGERSFVRAGQTQPSRR